MAKRMSPKINTDYILNQADPSRLEIRILDTIDPWNEDTSAKSVITQLLDHKDAQNIDVHITSNGGSVDEGLAIYGALLNHPAHVTAHITGYAYSMASVIAMAANTIKISSNAKLMIHNASTIAWGDKNDVTKTVEQLKQTDKQLAGIYAQRTGKPLATIEQWMNDTTFFTAAEAMDNGFVDEITPAVKVAAVYLTEQAAESEPDQQQTAQSTQSKPASVSGQQEDITMTLKEILNACKGLDRSKPDDAQFIMDQQEADATLEEIQAAWAETLQARIAARDKQIKDEQTAHAEALANAQKNGGKPRTNLPIGEGNGTLTDENTEGTGDAKEDFLALVAKKVASGLSRDRAIYAAKKADPALYKNYLISCNKGKGARRKIEEKLDDELSE